MRGINRAKNEKCQSAKWCARSILKELLAFLCLPLVAGSAYAASLGMVADNGSDELRLFDIQTGLTIASLKGSTGHLSGDCALSEDESTGFSSNE